jgi:mRNA-degrading endonuclease RelE of RelBE toxin-antitoxin system
MKDLEWSESSLEDMAALDKGIARRIQRSVERFAARETGNVKCLQGIDPPEYRLRIGDWRVRFVLDADTIVVLRVLNRKDAYR